MSDPVKLNIDQEKVKAWIQKGARPSDTARDFLIDQGLLPKESAKKRPTKPPKAKGAEAPTAEPATVGSEA
jgi:ribosomal protein S16